MDDIESTKTKQDKTELIIFKAASEVTTKFSS